MNKRNYQGLPILLFFFYLLIPLNCLAEDGLVAHWDFEEGLGIQTTDIIGGLSTYIFGAEFSDQPATGGGNHSLYCSSGSPTGNGSQQITFNINEDSFSISAWVKSTSTLKTRVVTIHTSGTGQAYWLDIANGGLFGIQIGTATPLQISNNNNLSLEDGNYHNLIGIHDAPNKKIRLYIDGTFVAHASTSGILGTVGGTQFSFCGNSGTNLLGNVDEVKIYNRVLSDSEILQEVGGSPNPSITLTEALDSHNLLQKKLSSES